MAYGWSPAHSANALASSADHHFRLCRADGGCAVAGLGAELANRRFAIVLERVGKAIRNPPRDVMLSHASKDIGLGFGFGLHEAMDQAGALIGPLVVAFILARHGTYRERSQFC